MVANEQVATTAKRYPGWDSLSPGVAAVAGSGRDPVPTGDTKKSQPRSGTPHALKRGRTEPKLRW